MLQATACAQSPSQRPILQPSRPRTIMSITQHTRVASPPAVARPAGTKPNACRTMRGVLLLAPWPGKKPGKSKGLAASSSAARLLSAYIGGNLHSNQRRPAQQQDSKQCLSTHNSTLEKHNIQHFVQLYTWMCWQYPLCRALGGCP